MTCSFVRLRAAIVSGCHRRAASHHTTPGRGEDFWARARSKVGCAVGLLPHPEGLRALLSRSGVVAQVTSPPFDSLALKDRGIHKVLTSDDVLGGPSTFLVLATSESFARENPKTTKAVLLAAEDAMALIKENRAKAAAVYLKRDDAKLDQTFVEQLLASTNNRYETGPVRIMKYVEFLLATKALRRAPSDWHELFLPLIRDKGRQLNPCFGARALL